MSDLEKTEIIEREKSERVFWVCLALIVCTIFGSGAAIKVAESMKGVAPVVSQGR